MRKSAVSFTRRAILAGAVVAGILLAGSLWAAVPAAAGGPTSALLVSKATGDTASLYHSDGDYERLMGALGDNPTSDREAPAWRYNTSPGGKQITITWLVHDVSIWRIDHVVAHAESGPWIQTHFVDDGVLDDPDAGVWHRAAQPKQLLDVLDGLGVLDEKTAQKAGGAASVPSGGLPAEGSAGGSAERQTPLYGWWWALPGLAAGLLAGVGGRPAAAWLSRLTARRRDPGSRRQLLDA